MTGTLQMQKEKKMEKINDEHFFSQGNDKHFILRHWKKKTEIYVVDGPD